MDHIELLQLSALSLAPIAFLFTYVYLWDRYEREPLKYLIITFFLGILIAIPVIILGQTLSGITSTSQDSTSIWGLLVYAFIVVAVSEEGMKYLVLRWYNYRHPEFDEPYDGIMYGVAVSLGFAAIENVLYVVWNAETSGIATGMVRMFTAVPAHAMFGVIMGYFVGKAKFLEDPKAAFKERMKGLLAAIFFHGIYDYFLFLGNEFLALFAFVALIIGIILARRAMLLHAEDSPHKSPPPPKA